MHNLFTVFLLLFTSTSVFAVTLPKQHQLQQTQAGTYFVVNKDNIVMIEPAIIKIGYNDKWILACIKNPSIGTDLIRWVFVNLENGGGFDSINQENWAYFRDEAYPELKTIELTTYRDEMCPE